MKPIAFFTDDLALTPDAASAELADTLSRPVTVAEFTRRTGNRPVAVYEDSEGNLIFEARPHAVADRQFISGQASA